MAALRGGRGGTIPPRLLKRVGVGGEEHIEVSGPEGPKNTQKKIKIEGKTFLDYLTYAILSFYK